MNIGDYVRTDKGIAKIIGKNDDVRYHYPNAYVTDTYLEINDDTEYVYDEDIIKSSPKIIDLIEVGDYINGRIVDEFIYLDKLGLIGLSELEKEDEKFIKSIVTREQFSQMEYKVGE